MKKIIWFLGALPVLAGCHSDLGYPADAENNINLNSLTTLNVGDNTIFLQDFVMNPADVDSITSSSAKLTCTFDTSKTTATLRVTEDMEHFVNIKMWVGGIPFSLPCRKTNKVKYTFRFNPAGKEYGRVQIAGQMNDWTPSRTPDLVLNDSGLYKVDLFLNPGTYLYQLSLDGEQGHDPQNPDKVDNGSGKFNSVLHVAGNDDKLPRIYTDKYYNPGIMLTSQNAVQKVYVYWQNYLLPDKYVKIDKNKIEIIIPQDARKTNRSFVRVWASNAWGVSNDVMVPLEKGEVLTSAGSMSRADKHAQIMYFMLVDRFKNGNTVNDRPLNRPDVNPKVDYWGGDLAGLQQKIEDGYFEKLGINTLWVSPLNQNPEKPYGYYAPMKTKFSGYHGYWPVSSSKVDSRFGTNEELKTLVGKAHTHNMNVLLDYVANHVHEEHPLYRQHPEFATNLHLPDGTLNVEKWDEHRLTTWFDTFMPSLDFSNPRVVEMMTDSALFWLKEFNLDGFRHDATKHINEEFWRTLTMKIKKHNGGKSLYQIGETYGSPGLISSYLTTGMLDGQFDFNVYDIANTTFAGVGGSNLLQVQGILNSSLYTYGSHNLMGNISGNHDKPRFMALASGDLKFGEDSKAAGWKRQIGITDSTAYNKLFLMHAFNMTIPGIPVIFYGDEIGLTGANDPDCRRMMRFDGWNNREEQLWNRVARLTRLRRDNPVLVYGGFINVSATKDSWVYARKYFDKEAIVFINNSAKTRTFDVQLPAPLDSGKLKATFGNKVQQDGKRIRLALPAFSAEVLLD